LAVDVLRFPVLAGWDQRLPRSRAGSTWPPRTAWCNRRGLWALRSDSALPPA